MKKLLAVFTLVVLLIMGCNAQPQSTWRASWGANPAVDSVNSYTVFVWQGANTTNCPLVTGVDYKQISLAGITTETITDTSYNFTVPNNGEYIVFGKVSVDKDGYYSGMVVASTQKGKVPGSTAVILEKVN